MENMQSQNSYKTPKDHLLGVATLFLLVATVVLVALFVKIVFGGSKLEGEPTISVTGEGEVMAVPDVAKITLTIREEAKTSKEAGEKMAAKEKKALDALADLSIEKKDIKTVSLNTYPKYDFEYASDVVCGPYTCPPRPGKQVISGYEATETIEVKIRDIEKTGEVTSALAAAGINEVYGPEFTIDDPDALREEVRKLAIEDAKEKAEILRKDLGVRLVRIVSFSEGGDSPIYYGRGGEVAMMDASKAEEAPAPAELPTGEQKITSNVTIVYEIR